MYFYYSYVLRHPTFSLLYFAICVVDLRKQYVKTRRVLLLRSDSSAAWFVVYEQLHLWTIELWHVFVLQQVVVR